MGLDVANHLGTIDEIFALEGETMQAHKGRGVVRLTIDEQIYFLKRYQLVPHQFFKRHVRLGFHELAMIDWLNANGFAGPKVVARGSSGRFGLKTRMYFLMEEVADEIPLERYWRRNRERQATVLDALAEHAARLHDRYFYHRDFSERHIYVGNSGNEYTFRQIDVERASVGNRDETKAAADLKTLAASVANETLESLLAGPFVDAYLSARKGGLGPAAFRKLYAKAQATKSF